MRIAAIGDIHVREGDDGRYSGLFARIAAECDVLLLCGDLTDTGKPDEAHRLASELSDCTVPRLAILGNHDHERGHDDTIRDILREAAVRFIDEQPYHLKDVAFTGVKGFGGGFGKFALGAFGEDIVKTFVSETVDEAVHLGALLEAARSEHNVVALHYAPIAETVRGEPLEIYPFLGSTHLMDTIDRFPVDAVFHGHAHHGSFKGATVRGTPVYNVSREVLRGEGCDYLRFELS